MPDVYKRQILYIRVNLSGDFRRIFVNCAGFEEKGCRRKTCGSLRCISQNFSFSIMSWVTGDSGVFTRL